MPSVTYGRREGEQVCYEPNVVLMHCIHFKQLVQFTVVVAASYQKVDTVHVVVCVTNYLAMCTCTCFIQIIMVTRLALFHSCTQFSLFHMWLLYAPSPPSEIEST